MLNENIKKIYNGQSGVYDLLFKSFFHPRQQHVIKNIDIKPNQNILDLGVGTGLSLPLYPAHCNVMGIDLSVDMLKRAKKKVDKHGLNNVTLKEMDASDLKFPDDTFDYVIATFVISVVQDPIKVIAEMKRVCKKSGTLIIVNHFKSRNPILAKIEKLINPFTCKIGWRSDLCLYDLIGKANLKINQKYKLKKIDFWNVIFAANNKAC